MSGRYYLAFDLGAESGRAVVGRLSGEELSLEVLHRFRNGPVEEGETQRWHTEGIWSEIRKGLTLAGEKCGGALAGIGLVIVGLLVLARNPTTRNHALNVLEDIGPKAAPAG